MLASLLNNIRDVAASQQGQSAAGAVNSAAVPSADTLEAEEDKSNANESKVNGTS
jgi:hypothetical protein